MRYKIVGEGLQIGNRWVSKDNTSWLEAVANGAEVIGETVTEPDYVALRTGPDGYASTGEQLGMIADGTQKAHVAEVKAKFPKTITGGESIADVPAWVQEKADAWLFNDQLEKYTAAVARLSQYVLADGRDEVTESQEVAGNALYNEETGEFEPQMMDVVVQTAIDPLPATVEQTTYDDEGNATVTNIENPLITQDNLERTDAQAVVDATPQAVKDAA
jgi:hypothetical protein